MAVTNYYTIQGAILGERSSSGRINYITDASDSVTGTVSASGVQTTYAYKPYGAVLSRTGVASDPKFLWLGARGYYLTTLVRSLYYYEMRYMSSEDGRFTSVNLISPTIMPYIFTLPSVTAGAYKFCNGCKSSDPKCPNLPWRTHTAKALLRNALIQVLHAIPCYCNIRFVGKIWFKFDQFCVESKSKDMKGMVPCWIKKDYADWNGGSEYMPHIDCYYNYKNCEPSCDEYQSYNIDFVSPLPRGPVVIKDFKIGQMQGKFGVKGKVHIYSCARKGTACGGGEGDLRGIASNSMPTKVM